ncbi:MAG: HAMP domain-containing histidine kinase [Marinilabiliaceae bacterium]|nr:HAMP domain-containing histidine kinase [Marinilabiliaceae bacterium]
MKQQWKVIYSRIKFEYLIVGLYLIIGGLWILFSDRMAANLTDNEELLTRIQTYKGWFYVLMTGISLFILLKIYLEKLRKAEVKAIENDQLKSAFLQNISHEMRTPMNAIIGFTEIMMQSEESEANKHYYLEVIHKSTQQLLGVVNDVVDISMIETGIVVQNKDKVELNLLMDDIYKSYLPEMKENIQLSLKKGQPGKFIYLMTDEIKLKRVLTNLLNNALKYTHKGQIEYGYRLKDHKVEFFVKDTGIGIAKELHSTIFERFKQAEIELARRTGGTGLGLSICKGLMDILGGDIWVESEPHVGSTFYFSLPAKVENEAVAVKKSVS